MIDVHHTYKKEWNIIFISVHDRFNQSSYSISHFKGGNARKIILTDEKIGIVLFLLRCHLCSFSNFLLVGYARIEKKKN
jgi:hypothetical protein